MFQELETLVAYLGLDWANEDVDEFLKSRGSHGLLQFMSTFVRIIEQVCAIAGGEREMPLTSIAHAHVSTRRAPSRAQRR